MGETADGSCSSADCGSLQPLPIEHAAVLGPIKAKPCGWPRKTRPALTGPAAAALTKGQVNAVRAALKAGVTPSRIARQFGLSQSDVRKALSSDKPNR
jgi:hypothetical protein